MRIKTLFCLLCLLFGSVCFAGSEPLPIEQAFIPSATLFGPDTVVLSWQIAPKHYVYQSRLHFKVLKPANTEIGHIIYPHGTWKEDEIFGKYEVYSKEISLLVPLINPDPHEVILEANYQGCSEAGYCYPPISAQFQIDFQNGTVHVVTNAKAATSAKTVSSQISYFSDLFLDHSIWKIVWAFLGIGLLLSLTPCVLPMIPILSGIIVGHQTTQMRGKTFRLSLVYVLSMAITYAGAGALVGWLGSTVQSVFQATWIIVLSSVLFVLLAGSFFGLYTLRLPVWFENRIASISGHQKKGHYLGVAVMGCLATLIISPCVTPALVGVLGYITQSGDAILGGIALFAMGLGMGIPLLGVGLLGNRFLPKAGAWMQTVEYLFGVLFIGMAIWMLSRILPAPLTLMLWSILCLISSVYLGALSTTPEQGFGKLHKGIGVILLVYGVLLLIGSAQGHDNPLQPLTGQSTAPVSTSSTGTVKTIKTLKAFNELLEEAKAQNKPILVDFYADWCVSCQEMERSVFRNPAIVAELSRFTVVKADITQHDESSKELMQHFQVIAPPTFLFLNQKGEWLKSKTQVGQVGVTEFLEDLKGVFNE